MFDITHILTTPSGTVFATTPPLFDAEQFTQNPGIWVEQYVLLAFAGGVLVTTGLQQDPLGPGSFPAESTTVAL